MLMKDHSRMHALSFLLMMIWWGMAESWICGGKRRACLNLAREREVTFPIFAVLGRDYREVENLQV